MFKTRELPGGFAPLAPPTRALPWTQGGGALSGPLAQKFCTPPPFLIPGYGSAEGGRLYDMKVVSSYVFL